MAAANDLRKGQAIKYNGNTAIVLEVHHRTPGNLRAFVQAIIRYINTGKSADVRFGSTDKVDLVDINRSTLEFSYKDNNGYHFMDPESYETVTLQDALIGDGRDYLVENLPVTVLYAE
jgi:elongation factor P